MKIRMFETSNLVLKVILSLKNFSEAYLRHAQNQVIELANLNTIFSETLTVSGVALSCIKKQSDQYHKSLK